MNKLRGVSLAAALAAIFMLFPVNSYAEEADAAGTAQELSYTREEALEWARSQKGQLIDVDGWYGAQCVDYIYAYYEFLGVGRRGGNGTDYQNDDKLPDGWTRLLASDGAVPLPGDVVVWAGGAYGVSSSDGHVGIIESVDENGNFTTLEQNYGTDRSVTLNAREAGHFTCLLRPNWKSTPEQQIVDTLADWVDSLQ